LGFLELQTLFKVQIKRDVLPPSVPLKNIRTFIDMCRFFFFPFMGVQSTLSEGGSSPDQKRAEHGGDSGGSDHSRKERLSPHLELWGRPPGLLKDEVHINFMGHRCHVSLHHMGGLNFRVQLTSLEL